ncbi:concanavalin A-like lectin/glucanase domain-containing protein [Gigaspora rosea]|uniref:Concanavalin A-like lectin/glucanase domain-containing protein n=1 Tax=Gigaspora rosea TaxID=44941 RepID=A0A397UM17_9GLOM|nr:concanavalin A-like lectin/glucanase domain-containing protein [Gigaspora rosea]
MTESMYSNNLEIDVPTRWSRNKASRLLTIYDDNLKIMYSGLGRNDDESAALIANNPFRSSIDVGYFEVYIIEDGCDNGFEGKIGIGFGAAGTSVRQLPGWFPGSYGYHGDDGNTFRAQFNGTPYSTTYGKGDTIGCCIDYQTRTAFFTKNGINLGIAFTNIPLGRFYPMVGLRFPGQRIEANFGKNPFAFDIQLYRSFTC